jgi:hypothetical protein
MDAERIYSVNEIIADLDRLRGSTVRIMGILNIEYEGDSIWHYPRREALTGFATSLWARFHHESLGRGRQQLREFNMRHVVVTAVVDPEFPRDSCLWAGCVIVMAISKLKRGQGA